MKEKPITPKQVRELTAVVARHLPLSLPSAVAQSVIDKPGDLEMELSELFRRLAEQNKLRSADDTFIMPLGDDELAERFPQFADRVPKYRKLAAKLGYTGPVAWLVKAGFALKTHAPKAGPCYEKFAYLQDWPLKNDEPTKDSVVFWIPWLLADSTGKDADDQMKFLAETRGRYHLPSHHLTSFGSPALVSALILAHFKRTGERVPLNQLWARTDTFVAGGCRLRLGDFDENGLLCSHWPWDDGANDNLGCFVLGVETLGN